MSHPSNALRLVKQEDSPAQLDWCPECGREFEKETSNFDSENGMCIKCVGSEEKSWAEHYRMHWN